MPDVTISEKFLLDTGGWQELKHARALVEMGRVVSLNYSAQLLRGFVREGERGSAPASKFGATQM
jgi:hypothetical protein